MGIEKDRVEGHLEGLSTGLVHSLDRGQENKKLKVGTRS